MKKILLFIFLMILFIVEVNAEACDTYDIKRLKEIADGVEITYELQEPFEDELGIKVYDKYKISVVGISDEIILYYKNFNEKILFYNYENMFLYGGTNILELYSRDCGNLLKKISLELPAYNSLYLLEECKIAENKNKEVCQKWTKKKYTVDEFYDILNDDYVTNKKNIFNLKNILFVSIFAIIIIVFILVIIYYSKKRGELK